MTHKQKTFRLLSYLIIDDKTLYLCSNSSIWKQRFPKGCRKTGSLLLGKVLIHVRTLSLLTSTWTRRMCRYAITGSSECKLIPLITGQV